MNRFISIFKNTFKRRGNDWIILIVSLFFAFVMWGILRLSQTYSTTFKYNVKVNTSVKGRSSGALSTNAVLVRGRASGFFILQQRYTSSNSYIELNVAPSLIHPVPGKEDLFFIKGSQIKDNISQMLEGEIVVDNISADSLFIYLFNEAYKKVPVVTRSNISFATQYTPVGKLTLKPDSVFIYGNTKIIDGIDSLFTEEITADKADKNLSGITRLQPVDGVEVSDKEIYYSMTVVRYYESVLQVPLSIVNSPADRSVPIPDEVKLIVKARFGKNPQKFGSQDFNAYIDFNDTGLKDSECGYAAVRVDNLPTDVIEVKPEPAFIKIY